MKFVIDTNIVFSAILNPESPIGQIILNGSKYFSFLSIEQLEDEIYRHQDKITKISGLNQVDFHKIYGLIKNRIKFVNHLLIDPEIREKAARLTHDVDPDDVLFVGLSIQFRCKLWSGDKKLIQGLKHKNFHQIITTDQLFHVYLDNELKRKRFREK